MPYFSGFENPAEQAGWFGSGGFGFGTTGGKLGGPRTGTSYAVTTPGAAASGTPDGQVAYLYTPFFDLTGQSAGTISWYQSIETEPSWDRSSWNTPWIQAKPG